MLPPPAKTPRASPPPPSMVFMSASRRASGNCLRKAGTTFETPWVLSSGVPISTISTPPASAALATVSPRSKVPTSTEI